MAMFEWRKFNFFDLKPMNDKFAKTIMDADISSSTCGNNQVVVCDMFGFVHVFSKKWESYSFKAHDGPILLCELTIQGNFLITVGNEEEILNPEFKVWNLSKLNKTVPACLKTVKTAVQKPTALGVSEGGQFMAIGFDRGNVSFYKGDISRDRNRTVKTLTFGTSAVKGIAFKYNTKVTQMFVCSDSGVYLYTIQGRDKEFKTILETISTPTTCCALQLGHNEGHFMVGRDDAIYCYTSDGRGPCYALEGRKHIIRWFRSHLMIVSTPVRENAAPSKISTLTVIDIVNKFIVFTAQVETITAIFIEFGTCYLTTISKMVYHLDEKDLQSKLNLLFKKNLYDTAVKIAKNNQYDAEGLAEIFKQYGDHLYSKGNFAGAVEQYIKTTGYLEPSYVIRRFLDSRHTQFLTDYLESLHKEGKASADHTTLLLNCFTRLDRINDLKLFLDHYKQDNSLFDIDVAIKVCRKSCVEQALELAKINRKHDYAISILIEDLKLYSEVLDYIAKLPYIDSEKNLKKYGHILMENSAQETVELLKKLCTDYIMTKSSKKVGQEIDDNLFDEDFDDEFDGIGSPEEFMHLFTDSKQLIDYIEYLIKHLPGCSPLVYNTLIEHYLDLWQTVANNSGDKITFENRLIELIKNYEQSYDKNHVLVLCRTYKFWLGVMLIYEGDQLYHLIVRHYLKTRDYQNLYLLCKRLGTTEPSIWLHTLNGLRIDNNQVPASFLAEILQVIAVEKLQSPLQVLNDLTSIENGPNLSSVRSYFTQIFQKEHDSVKIDEEKSEKYRLDSESIRKHISSLQQEPVEFRSTICDACHTPLNLPSLFFLCKHSYHQDCIRNYSETEKDCPVCRKRNNQLCDTIHLQSESRSKHNEFHRNLNSSVEPFALVADYFGRGLFNKILLVDEDDEDTTKISQKPTSDPTRDIPIPSYATNYGAAAEAKLRLDERPSKNTSIQPSEGRMRVQEQRSTQARDIIAKAIPKIPVPIRVAVAKPEKTKIISNKVPNYPKNPFDDENDDMITATKNKFNPEEPKNPFDEDDSLDADNYDKNKNPFED